MSNTVASAGGKGRNVDEQGTAEEVYQRAVRQIGIRWKELPVNRRVSEELAKIRSDELIKALRQAATLEREHCALLVDRFRREHPEDLNLSIALEELARRIRCAAQTPR